MWAIDSWIGYGKCTFQVHGSRTRWLAALVQTKNWSPHHSRLPLYHCDPTFWGPIFLRIYILIILNHSDKSAPSAVISSDFKCLWPAKQDGSQPFHTREIRTGGQNAVHHQAGHQDLGYLWIGLHCFHWKRCTILINIIPRSIMINV